MKCLVTGATGFLGSYVTEACVAAGDQVRAMIREAARAPSLEASGVEVVVADVRDAGAVTRAVAGVDVVFHCAAATGDDVSESERYETNLGGVRNILEAVASAGRGRVVLITGASVLGMRDLDPATEELPYRRTKDPDSDVKIQIERLALERHRADGLAVSILRPGFVYGPRDRRNMPQLVEAIRAGKFAFVGSRDNVVPMVYVTDMVQVMRLAAATRRAAGRVYMVSDGGRTTIGTLADYISELIGCARPHRVFPFILPHAVCVTYELMGRLCGRRCVGPVSRAGLLFLGTSRFLDISRARRELGYAPQVGYREGVATTVRWIGEHFDAGQSERQHSASSTPREGD